MKRSCFFSLQFPYNYTRNLPDSELCPSFQQIICSCERPGSTRPVGPPSLRRQEYYKHREDCLPRLTHISARTHRTPPRLAVSAILSGSREESPLWFQWQHCLSEASNKKDPENQAAQPGKHITLQSPSLSHSSLDRQRDASRSVHLRGAVQTLALQETQCCLFTKPKEESEIQARTS